MFGGVGSIATGAVGRSLNIGELVIGVGVALSPLLWVVLGRDFEDTETATYLRWFFFVVVLGSILGFSWLETGGRPLEWIVRTGHVGSFALWIGGASWHNFVVLPTVRTHPDAADEIKAGARRFRRHLPAVIALFFVTGIYQAIRVLGYSVSTLVGTPAGRLVVVKFVVLAVLTVLVAMNLKRAQKTGGPDR